MNERATKPRSDSVLKNLPPERQAQIAEWCAKPSDREEGKVVPRSGGLAYAQDQLAADGLKVSLDTLSRFFSWWELERDMEISFEHQDAVLSKTGDARKAREAGETLLMRLGLAKQEPKLIAAAAAISDSRRSLDLTEESGKTKARQKDAQLAQKDRDLSLTERRVAVLEKKFADAAQTLGDKSLTMPEREARMKEMFGIGA